MNIKDELSKFYDAHAEKYYHTRNKHRADADVFLNEIKGSEKKTINILEFGCGSGRLLAHLDQLTGITIKYIGVDISQQLLHFAQKQVSGKKLSSSIKTTFVCDDIAHYLVGLKQESFDFVIGISSFQHIPTNKERFFIIKNIYRILKYDGKLLMTNRSFSLRFLKKYQRDFLRALWKYIISLGKHQWNDLMVPWKNGKTIAQRFYHIFTLAELKTLISLSGFIIEKIGYLSKGEMCSSRKESQNTIVIAKKSIFLKNE